MLSRKQVVQAIDLLNKNQVIILPTNTLYGLSAKVTLDNKTKINELKKAPLNKPLIILIKSISQLKEMGISNYDKELLCSKVPTTVILENNIKEKIAVRLIKRRDIKKIISKTGPIYSTSVNLHSQEVLTSDEEIIAFDTNLSVFIDKKLLVMFDKKELKPTPSRIYDFVEKKWIRY